MSAESVSAESVSAESGSAEATAAWERYLTQLEQWTSATDTDPSLGSHAPQPPVGEPMPDHYSARAHQVLARMRSTVQHLSEARDDAGRQLSRLKDLPAAAAADSGEARYLDRSA